MDGLTQICPHRFNLDFFYPVPNDNPYASEDGMAYAIQVIFQREKLFKNISGCFLILHGSFVAGTKRQRWRSRFSRKQGMRSFSNWRTLSRKKRKIEEEGTNVRKKLLRSVPLTKKNLRFDLVVGRRYLEKLRRKMATIFSDVKRCLSEQ